MNICISIKGGDFGFLFRFSDWNMEVFRQFVLHFIFHESKNNIKVFSTINYDQCPCVGYKHTNNYRSKSIEFWQ